MPHRARIRYHARRGGDLCHVSFRQTLELLRVTDEALEAMCHECGQVPDFDSLVLRALNEMARNTLAGASRAPRYVFLVHGRERGFTGTLYRLGPDGYRVLGEPIRFAAQESHAFSAGAGDLVVSNAQDENVSMEAYQQRFHPTVRQTIGEPIRNFVTYRVAGDRPGALIAFNYPDRATRYEGQVLAALSVTLGALWTLASRMAQVEEGFIYLVGALARASEVNDEVTGAHILRVSRYAETLARAVGYPENEARVIGYSAQLHDVGKIHTPRQILTKPGPLTPDEEALMRQHALQGEKIIGTAPRLAVARRIAGGHHENWDGSGYPRALAGEEIPREARLVKVVDVYDALRSERPYKRAFTHEEALEIISRGDDRLDPSRLFDPALIAAFTDIHAEFRRIHAAIGEWA